MIVDLKDKWPYLFSLVPVLIWSILLENFSILFLLFLIISIILTGITLATDEYFLFREAAEKDKPKLEIIQKFLKHGINYKESLAFKIVFCILFFWGCFSAFCFSIFVFVNSNYLYYYHWLLFSLIWTIVLSLIFLLLTDPIFRIIAISSICSQENINDFYREYE